MNRTQVFISYSHQDAAWLERLQVHLKPLEREGLIERWDDTRIKAGQKWAGEIEKALISAKVAVLLVSADFLASDFIAETELPPLLAAAKQDSAVILPVIVSPSRFKKTALAQFQAVNSPDEPLIKLTRAKQEEILVQVSEAVEDEIGASRVDTAPVPGKPWNVPLKLSPFFIGREALLAQLRDVLITTRAVALTGLGGIGKTQTALAYVHAHGEYYQAVLWVRAASREDLVAGFVALASELNLPEKDAQEQALAVNAVRRWLHNHDNWLLILDNADELTLLKEFIPEGKQGRLLLTTRAHATGMLAQGIPVEKLDVNFGALFLLRRAVIIAADAPFEAALETEQAHARALVEALDGLPLALEQAGAFMEENRLTPGEYLELYRQEGEMLRDERGTLGTEHPSATVTFSLAFDKTATNSPAAAELLRLCAFLDPVGIPEELFTKGASELGEVLDQALTPPLGLVNTRREVCRLSLMQRDPQNKILMIHPVVQEVIKDGMNTELQRQWAECAVRAVNTVFPHIEFSNWSLCNRLLSQALRCAALIEAWGFEFEEAGRLLNETAYYLHERARYEEAEPLFQRALAIREKALGPEHPDVATSLNNLAELYRTQGRYEEAEPLLQRALAIAEKTLGPEHPDVGTHLNNLAALYDDQGRYEEAEPLYQRALAIAEKALGPEHPHVGRDLNNLALLYYAQGRYEAAEPLYQRALAIAEKALGPEHPHVGASLNNLAKLYDVQGRYEAAEPLYQRALTITEKALGPEHPHVVQIKKNYALLLSEMGRSAGAGAVDASAGRLGE